MFRQKLVAQRYLWLLAGTLLVLGGCNRKSAEDTGTNKSAESPTPSGSTPATGPAPKSNTGGSSDSKDTRPSNGDAARPSLTQFTDIADEAGIDFQFFADQVPGRFFLVESMGGAAAWLDFDLDGHPDLCLPNGSEISAESPQHHNELFRNCGGRFERVSAASGTDHTAYAFGVAVGDFDADGFPDLFITNWGPNTLLRNNGDGTFTELESETWSDSLWSTGCVWFDANNDGLPDLYIANYLQTTLQDKKTCLYHGLPGYCGPQNFEPQADQVIVNNGDGTFRDATEALGFRVAPAYSLGVMATDLTNDSRPEIVVATDMTANSLFVQDPSGRWADHGSPAGVAAGGNGELEAGMGIACADFDGDQHFDFLLTHYYEKKNTLYRNLGDLVFSDNSLRSGIALTSTRFLGFGTNVLDVNGDAAPDLFIANGHVLGPNHDPNAMTAQVLLNNGRGRFRDVSADCGEYFSRRVLGRGSATADFDHDGDLDVAVVHLDQPLALLEASGAPASWLGLNLRAPTRTGLAGGRVEVRSAGSTRVIPLTAGGSYLSVSDPRVVLTLPEPQDAELSVRIVWPGGESMEFKDLKRNRYWDIGPGRVHPSVY